MSRSHELSFVQFEENKNGDLEEFFVVHSAITLYLVFVEYVFGVRVVGSVQFVELFNIPKNHHLNHNI